VQQKTEEQDLSALQMDVAGADYANTKPEKKVKG